MLDSRSLLGLYLQVRGQWLQSRARSERVEKGSRRWSADVSSALGSRASRPLKVEALLKLQEAEAGGTPISVNLFAGHRV